MAFPRGPRFPIFPAAAPSSNSKAQRVLGVGWRVIVNSPGSEDRVTLTDETGTSALATVAHGAEVEILAWRPHRGGDTRYRVVSTGGGVEGWLGGASLRARPPSPSLTVAAPVGPPKTVTASPKRARKRAR